MMSSSEIQACEDREADGEFVPMDENRWEEMNRGMNPPMDPRDEFRAKNPEERFNLNTGKFEPNLAAL